MKPPRVGTLDLLRSRPGRLEVRRRVGERLWPVVAQVALVYRLTLGRRIRIVAVIGSVGKTTTMRAISAALDRPVSTRALLNVNSQAAIGRTLMSTPPWRRLAVQEVGISAPGHMRIQARTLRPNLVVVTAIASDHWESFGTLEATRHEKAEILRSLPADGVAVINADDHHVRWMGTQTRARVVLAGFADDAEVRASDVEIDWPHGMRFVAHVGGEAHEVRTKLMGRHMVFPALAAIAVAHLEGVQLVDAIARIASLEPTPGRMQTMVLANGAAVLRDDFKATVDAFESGLETVAALPVRRRIAVIGEVSEERSHNDYREMGGQAATVFDRVVFVGTSKKMTQFRAGAVAAGLSPDMFQRARNAHEALQMLGDDPGPGDVVFIKGRWQQALGRVGLALAGREVRCRADPCPFKRMLCDICPFLEQDFYGLGGPSVEPN